MATVTLTNQVASQSLRGESCKITVDLGTQSSEFSQLQVGQLANCNGYPTCYVYSVDVYGNSFQVAPRQPNIIVGSFGYVDSNIDIEVTI